MKAIVLAVAMVLLVVSAPFAADCTDMGRYMITPNYEVVKVKMTGAASGGAFTACDVPLVGYLHEVIVDGDNTVSPTDAWDWTLIRDGRDLLNTLGANMTDTERKALSTVATWASRLVDGKYAITITNSSVDSAVINFEFYLEK